MKKFNIALIPGDGIGPDVVNEGVKVLKAIEQLDKNISFSFTSFPWGCEYYLEHGRMMDEDGIETLKQFDAIYLGAVGYPGVPDHISLWDLLLRIRKEFDLYVNLRPITLLHEHLTPLKNKTKKDIDFLVIRENSEGEYAGAGDWLFKGKAEEVVLQTGVFSRKGTERIIRYAYEEARKQKKSLDLKLRPITLLHEHLTPLKNKTKEDIDFLVIRENSEGEYAGAGDWLFKGKAEEVVLQTGVFSRKGTERIIRYAYEEARKQKKS